MPLLFARQLSARQPLLGGCVDAVLPFLLPELVARHHERMATREQLDHVFEQLKCARQDKGLSLADLTRLSGMDRSALSKLETGQRPNPTIETLMRYADAVGKRLVLTVADV